MRCPEWRDNFDLTFHPIFNAAGGRLAGQPSSSLAIRMNCEQIKQRRIIGVFVRDQQQGECSAISLPPPPPSFLPLLPTAPSLPLYPSLILSLPPPLRCLASVCQAGARPGGPVRLPGPVPRWAGSPSPLDGCGPVAQAGAVGLPAPPKADSKRRRRHHHHQRPTASRSRATGAPPPPGNRPPPRRRQPPQRRGRRALPPVVPRPLRWQGGPPSPRGGRAWRPGRRPAGWRRLQRRWRQPLTPAGLQIPASGGGGGDSGPAVVAEAATAAAGGTAAVPPDRPSGRRRRRRRAAAAASAARPAELSKQPAAAAVVPAPGRAAPPASGPVEGLGVGPYDGA